MRREFLKRLKAAFDERGIDIPFPHRTLYLATDTAPAVLPVMLLTVTVIGLFSGSLANSASCWIK